MSEFEDYLPRPLEVHENHTIISVEAGFVASGKSRAEALADAARLAAATVEEWRDTVAKDTERLKIAEAVARQVEEAIANG